MTRILASAGRRAVQFPAATPKPRQRDTARLNASPRCGAHTRCGGACRAPAVRGKARCRMHGGAWGSGGQPGNRNAWKHGFYGREAKAEERRHQARLHSARDLLQALKRAGRGRPTTRVVVLSRDWDGRSPAPAEILGCMGSFAKFVPLVSTANDSANVPPGAAEPRMPALPQKPFVGPPAPRYSLAPRGSPGAGRDEV